MKIKITKTLDTAQLYDDIVEGDFESYSACEAVGLHYSDLTPELMAMIFSALADEAVKRNLMKENEGRV